MNQINFSVAEFEKKLIDKKTKPVGKLTISTTVGFGATWLTPRINKFTNEFPDIEISLLMSDEEVDLSSRVADVAVRVKKPSQGNLIFKKFVNFHNHIYGSSEYLQKNLMNFTTNQKNSSERKKQLEALYKTLKFFGDIK